MMPLPFSLLVRDLLRDLLLLAQTSSCYHSHNYLPGKSNVILDDNPMLCFSHCTLLAGQPDQPVRHDTGAALASTVSEAVAALPQEEQQLI